MKLFMNKLGQSTVEYIMIFLLVVLVIIGGLGTFANTVKGSIDTQTAEIQGTLDNPTPTNP